MSSKTCVNSDTILNENCENSAEKELLLSGVKRSDSARKTAIVKSGTR